VLLFKLPHKNSSKAGAGVSNDSNLTGAMDLK